MKASEIFAEFEKMAIDWGKQYQIVKVGDIVTSKLGGKRLKRVQISSVCVTIGRNAKGTTRKTLVIEYAGRRIDSKGNFKDGLGTGVWLSSFTTEDGKKFDWSENEVTETANDVGLSFYLDFDKETKKLYPNAYPNYKDENNFYSR